MILPKGTTAAASNQIALGSMPDSFASGKRIRKFLNLPYETMPSPSRASALQSNNQEISCFLATTSTFPVNMTVYRLVTSWPCDIKGRKLKRDALN